MWPDLVIVHGKPRHPQSRGSVERANCDIKDMLIAWMSDNDTRDSTVGFTFVQFQKNSSLTLESSVLPLLLCLVLMRR